MPAAAGQLERGVWPLAPKRKESDEQAEDRRPDRRRDRRERTAFGDDNHAAIDAQLAVLRERMSSEQVYDAYGDEGADEFDQHTFDAALSAHDWMTGALASDEDAPAASWSGAEA